MTKLTCIGVLAHPHRPSTLPFAERVSNSIREAGYETWLQTAWDASAMTPLVQKSDMVVALGGDGAMLRAARACAPFNVPVLGLNAGYLGFLTEASPEEWPHVFGRLQSGDYWIEDRMMVTAEVWQHDQMIVCTDGLNEVVISRGSIARSVWLETYIDDLWATTYNADGLIVASPTGSTAYALAVGGPILSPQLRNILLIPVAAHLSMDRPLILSAESQVKILNIPRNQDSEVTVTVDGELIATMGVNDYVVVRASDKLSRFVRLREKGYFYRSLLDRMEPRLAVRHDGASRLEKASDDNT